MGMTSTVRGYGTAARSRAEVMGHRMRDRVVQRRLDRVTSDADRLRRENDLLRDEVADARSEHRRILELLDERLPQNGRNGSHRGRWLVLLLAIGGGAYAAIRRMRQQRDDWTGASSDNLAAHSAA